MIQMEEKEGGGGEKEIPKSRDIRRHYCEFCGLCRSKKALITSHILSEHKEELEKQKTEDSNEEKEGTKSNICEECGASFTKPAHLKQHMQSHLLEHWIPSNELQNAKRSFVTLNGLVTGWGTSCEAPSRKPQSHAALYVERPFACPVDDCHSSYRRKDHLTRHMLQHEGKLFTCPFENCNRKFAYQGNMTRHIKELHDDEEESSSGAVGKEYICQEIGCGKKFKFPSKLRKHEESHVKLDSVETICGEPGCMKSFTNTECLKAHVLSCHQHIHCEICGTKQLKKNIKRHMRIHEAENISTEKINCTFKGCLHTFTTKSNLNQHIKAVHLELLPFTCRVAGCGKKFPFKHVRDNHEKSGSHVYIQGDFEDLDELFQSRPRGGRKRSYPSIETMVMRKRVVPPSQTDSVFSHGSEYLAWSLSEAMEEE